MYGCEEELVDPAAAPEPVVAGGANERVRENPFNAWPESWEDQAVFEPEVSGTTGRYQLKTKFVGMHMYDPDEGVEEHRIIVELEWNKTKPKGWKTNTPQDWKQWKAVTELDPKHHQEDVWITPGRHWVAPCEVYRRVGHELGGSGAQHREP